MVSKKLSYAKKSTSVKKSTSAKKSTSGKRCPACQREFSSFSNMQRHMGNSSCRKKSEARAGIRPPTTRRAAEVSAIAIRPRMRVSLVYPQVIFVEETQQIFGENVSTVHFADGSRIITSSYILKKETKVTIARNVYVFIFNHFISHAVIVR